MRPFFAKKIAAVTGQQMLPNGTVAPLPAAVTNEGLAADIAALKQINVDLYGRLLTQMQTMQSMAQLVNTIVGGDSVAASLKQLTDMLNSNLQSDQTTAADLLSRIQSVSTVANTATTNVQIARQVADTALSATQTLSTTVVDHGQKIASVTTAASTAQTTATAAQTAASSAKTVADKGVADAATALTEANKRLLKAGDTASGQIKGPLADATALGKTAYTRFEQVLGGINQPGRLVQNAGAVSLPFDALTDTTGLNRRLLVERVTFLMTEAPPASLLGSVTLKIGTTSGGAEVYSKTVSTSVLSGLLNKLQPETLAGTATIVNAGTVLYATVTPSSGTNAGKWIAFVGTVFIPNAS